MVPESFAGTILNLMWYLKDCYWMRWTGFFRGEILTVLSAG